MLIFSFCAILAVAWLLPETSLGRLLRRLLVEAPGRALGRLTPARAVFGLLVIVALAAFVQFAKTDGLMMVAQAIPEGVAWFAAFDVATYIDVIALVWLVAATVRLRVAWRALRSAGARIGQWVLEAVSALTGRYRHGAGRREVRSRRSATPPPQNDQDDWRGPGFAGLRMAA